MTVKLLTEHHLEIISLKGEFTCSSESTLVKIPHCRKSRVTAHIFCVNWEEPGQTSRYAASESFLQ